VSNPSDPIAQTVAGLPPILRAELESAPLGRGRWYRTIGPAYLSLFVWVPFFDSLWIGDLTRYSLPWLVVSAFVASALCFGLLYYIPASWGFRTGRPLGIVAASTFGTVGSEWITGLAVAVASVVWYAVAIDYAVDSTLLGLKSCGLIASDSLRPWNLGPIAVKSPVYLTTAIFWIYITGTAGIWKLPGVVVALMRVYAPVALLLLTAVGVWQLPDMSTFRPEAGARIAAHLGFEDRLGGHDSVVQLIVGFFAMAGFLSVDWGARAERRRDVMVGGLTGIVLAASWTAVMSLAVVAGTVGRVGQESQWYHNVGDEQYERSPLTPDTSRGVEWYLASIGDPTGLTFRWAVYHGIGGVAGGAILILFGLAALAPACYAAWVYSQRLSAHWPRLGQFGWTWIGGAIALLLGATSIACELELIFFVMGAVFAPAVGAMAADWLRQRGAWAGVRPGINRTGVIAWVAGIVIALSLEFGRVEQLDRGWRMSHDVPWWQSTALCGFVASFVYYLLLAGLGRQSPVVRIGGNESGD
jgi:cytosine permease